MGALPTVDDMTPLVHTQTPSPRRRHRRTALLTLVAVLLVVGAAPTLTRLLRAQPDHPVMGTDQITVTDDSFEPSWLQVPTGATVTWTFDDGGRAHNVVGDGWSSAVLEDGAYERTFTAPGTFSYRCTLHWGMTGRIDVTP